MDVSARWSELMRLPEDRVPLDEAALLISAHANPGLDVGAQLARLDDLAGMGVGAGAAGVCALLFDRLGLRGDRAGYYDPANSYIDQVLDRRLGIPISLSVLLIEIGRRRGVRLEPVGMPGHFLVRDPQAPEQLIDAFDGGRRLTREDCERLLRALGSPVSGLTPGMLGTTGTRAVLARMLANLDGCFERRGDHGSLAWVSRLRMAVPGASLPDRVQLAARLSSIGQLDAAAGVLEQAAAETDTGTEVRDRLLGEASTLRARLN